MFSPHTNWIISDYLNASYSLALASTVSWFSLIFTNVALSVQDDLYLSHEFYEIILRLTSIHISSMYITLICVYVCLRNDDLA